MFDKERCLKFCPEPTYSFNVGDKVFIGNLTNCVISDVSDDKKVYTVEYDREEGGYGRGRLRHCKDEWLWYEIRPRYDAQIPNHDLIKNEDIISYSNRDINGLLTNVYHFGTNVSPSYQRDYVWSIDDQKALIDSIFHNIDIGKFVFASTNDNTGCWHEIIDGKQRLKAITDFYENKFDYKGFYYNDLSRYEQGYFKRYPISYAELRNASEETKLRLFILLNTRGISVEEQHVKDVKKMYEEKFGEKL